MADSSSFDPYTQPFTYLLADGSPVNATFSDLDDYRLYGIQACINYGTQIGASVIALIMVLVMTRPDKRASLLYWLNTATLTLNVIRTVLLAVYFTSSWYHPYIYLATAYDDVSDTDYNTSIASEVFPILVQIGIELSLVLQVRVVCVTMTRTQRFWVMILTGSAALLAITFRFAQNVIKAVTQRSNFLGYEWLASATNIITTISIGLFCLVFVAKLGWAIYQRRKMGLRQFGPMQIVFVGGCQTLLLPLIFCIFQYVGTATPVLSSQVITSAAISLPLTSLWASNAIENRAMQPRMPQLSTYRNVPDSTNTNSTSNAKLRKSYEDTVLTDLTDSQAESSIQPRSPFQNDRGFGHDLEAQRGRGGVVEV